MSQDQPLNYIELWRVAKEKAHRKAELAYPPNHPDRVRMEEEFAIRIYWEMTTPPSRIQ